MHEMAIAASILELAQSEAAACGCSRLLAVSVQHGQLSGIMPEALELAFRALAAGTPNEGARLHLERLPLRLRCAFCGSRFGGEGQEALHMPCPGCGEEFGHIIEQGKELLLARVEAI